MNATLNTNSNLDPQTPEARLAHVEPQEQPYEGGGWPGDGSGTDDLADMNANEADDYRNEGNEDAGLDAYWEGLTDLGD